ncbi:MAG: threonylcarbamoyl-AMP synthase [Reichenbachiella sp.]
MAQIGNNIEFAIALLTQGKLVAIPTDTVYGLAGNAMNGDAIEKIFEVKARPKDKALIAMTHSIKKASLFLNSIPMDGHKLAEKYWPGALTLIFEANTNIPKSMIANGDTVGVRVPDHVMTLELLKDIDFPLAVTSANLSGQKSPTSAQEVNEQIGDQIDYILDGGQSPLGFESTIVGFTEEKPVILRSGAIADDDIFKTLNID